MRRSWVVLIVGLSLIAADVRAGGLDVRLGAFFPRADSNLFRDDAVLYTRGGPPGPDGNPPPLETDDWIGVFGGLEYNQRLAKNLEIAIAVDGYERDFQTAYREYTREDDRDITQVLRLSMVPLGVSLRLVPTSRRAAIAPFVAVGVDVVFWHYEEYGDFIDFSDQDLPIVPDAFVSDGTTVGFHVSGGVRVKMTDDVSLVAEGRYQWAEDEMGDDFFRSTDQNRIDLSGVAATLGVHIRF
jgi:opacity protein-like surface antigen